MNTATLVTGDGGDRRIPRLRGNELAVRVGRRGSHSLESTAEPTGVVDERLSVRPTAVYEGGQTYWSNKRRVENV